MMAYALPQLLATDCGVQVEDMMNLTPWRKKNEFTSEARSPCSTDEFTQCLGSRLVELDKLKIPATLLQGIGAG